MKILAVETSCDDTGIAILEIFDKGIFSVQGGPQSKADELRAQASGWKILSNIISSQIKIHKKYGGVYPTLAKREHQKNLVPVLVKALEKAELLKTQNPKIKAQSYNSKLKILKKILSREESLYKEAEKFLKKYKKPDVDAIAVTIGPGLEPCLWVGVNFVKVLAYFWNIPIIPVNHIEAHILANWLSPIGKNKFPAICLIVSGGHTQIILMADFGKYKVLGETRDDAAGECFDKTARILGLEYPGGPVIAAKATEEASGGMTSVSLPRPMINTKDYDFSFSGLKTAVLYDFKNRTLSERKSKNYIRAMCNEIQQAVIDVLIKKTIKVAKDFKAKTIILGGGVSANEELRKQFEKIAKKNSFMFQVPSFKLCTDNALMVAVTGYFNKAEKTNWEKIKAEANLRIS